MFIPNSDIALSIYDDISCELLEIIKPSVWDRLCKVLNWISFLSTSGTNTYDSPSDVAAAMSGSLAGVMDVFSPESKREGRQKRAVSI